MAGMFKKALARLDSSPLEAVADTLAFDTIDPARLAQRLELQRHGTERGKRNEPRTETETFDSIEHTIVTEVEEYRRKAVDRVSRSLEAYSARLRSFDFEQVRVDMIAAINLATSTFAAEVHQGANELFQKRRSVIGTTRDVEAFQKKHRIERQAHLPESRTWIWGVLIALWLVEMLLNGALFAGGLSGGLIEGVTVAAGIASLNVLVGFGIGIYVVRFLLYRNVLIRLFAALGLALDLAINVFFNLGVARFRSALGSADPEAALIAAFGVPPLEVFMRLDEIFGFQSYILIGLGILFHAASIIDGFKYDDPYPFYGKYWRKREAAETDYAQTKEQLIEFLTSKRDETIQEMQDASRGLSSSRRLAARIAESRALTRQRFDTYVDNLERVANQLLALYREANAAGRTTSSPRHFAANWRFPHRHSLGATADGGALVDDDIARRTQADLEKGIADVSAKYVEAVTTYKQIESALENELYDVETISVAA